MRKLEERLKQAEEEIERMKVVLNLKGERARDSEEEDEDEGDEKIS